MTDAVLTSEATVAGGTGEPIIQVEGVSKWFDDFQALKDVTLTVGRQEVVVVCGPSGSGKSTLIRCINRLEEHDEGASSSTGSSSRTTSATSARSAARSGWSSSSSTSSRT
jgi:ABC-type polar amino acid transport system ATPase subunit